MEEDKVSNRESPADEEREIPLCVRCLHPIPEGVYYCPHCGHVANTLTPYLPFINIPFYADFWADSIKTSINNATSTRKKVFLVLIFFFLFIGFAPLLVLLLFFALFFMVFKSWSKSTDENCPEWTEYAEDAEDAEDREEAR